ncbi:acyl carrier protein [Nitratireductor sp. CAU 1489]|uniref:Acyl carrier protein n=1 Tax=Nitratireductor arenosus TaxID=2682096 RepID=A0A844QF69_9HYPH|nr:acyl carrier protein [Nitratireductor arenosus]MVA96728.1 acyl carrier protein [Nitratireductor arenosus]
MSDRLTDDILDKIADHAGLDKAEITADTELMELGIHSLELTEIIFDIEEKYDIEVEMNTSEAWSRLKNVGDVVKAVRDLIEAKS